MVRYFMIDEEQVRALERLRSRLHSEQRMDGDEMRDHGHTLDAIVRVVRELEIPDKAL